MYDMVKVLNRNAQVKINKLKSKVDQFHMKLVQNTLNICLSWYMENLFLSEQTCLFYIFNIHSNFVQLSSMSKVTNLIIKSASDFLQNSIYTCNLIFIHVELGGNILYRKEKKRKKTMLSNAVRLLLLNKIIVSKKTNFIVLWLGDWWYQLSG